MLEDLVTKTLFDVHFIERALHDRSQWLARWAGRTAPVTRTAQDDGVIIEATFVDFCLLGDPDLGVEIVVDGEVIAYRPIPYPGDGGFTFKWTLTIDLNRRVKAA